MRAPDHELRPNDVERMWQGTLALMSVRRAARARRRRWVSYAVVVAVVWIAAWALGRARVPPRTVEGHAVAQLEGSTHQRFADGSVVELHDGLLTPVEDEQGRARFALRSGRVTVDVAPGEPWVLDSELARIEIVGSRFSVTRTDDALTIELERGEAVVYRTHDPGALRLLAGERLVVTAPTIEEVAEATPRPLGTSPASPLAGELELEPTAGAAALPRPLGTSPASPLAGERELERPAYAEATPRPLGTSPSSPLTGGRKLDHSEETDADAPGGAPRLALDEDAEAPGRSELDLADAARERGDFRLAAKLYLRGARMTLSRERASSAAFGAGQILFDELADYVAAGDAFELALELGLSAGWDDIAMARAAESYRRGGHRERAARWALRYLDRAPHGPYAASLRTWVERR
ncbi:MAG: FecR family protein [Deltaproteobacteria bacterium]